MGRIKFSLKNLAKGLLWLFLFATVALSFVTNPSWWGATVPSALDELQRTGTIVLDATGNVLEWAWDLGVRVVTSA